MRYVCLFLALVLLFATNPAEARPGGAKRGKNSSRSAPQTRERDQTQTREVPARERSGNEVRSGTQADGTRGSEAHPRAGAATAATVRARTMEQMSAQQQANLTQLRNDLAGLQAESQVTQEQKQELSQSLQTLAHGTTRPSQESVDQLAGDMSAALADEQLTKSEQIKLAQDVAAVMNSANIPPEEVQAVIQDVEDILISSGVDQSDVETIVADLQAISAELQGR